MLSAKLLLEKEPDEKNPISLVVFCNLPVPVLGLCDPRFSLSRVNISEITCTLQGRHLMTRVVLRRCHCLCLCAPAKGLVLP